jgi:hypothetical protein
VVQGVALPRSVLVWAAEGDGGAGKGNLEAAATVVEEEASRFFHDWSP